MKLELKLMIVSPYFYPKVGDLENYAFNIANGLKENIIGKFC